MSKNIGFFEHLSRIYKKSFRKVVSLALTITALLMTSCGSENSDVDEIVEKKYITVGFSQVGAESDWRRANTESMKEALCRENGFDLIYMDGQQKQTNQIMAVRTFIQQGVDYIVLAPVKEDGFSTALSEAQAAGIPVIIVDRMVETQNSPFTCFVGSDFRLEGMKVVEWLHSFAEAKGIDESKLNIVDVQGTLGSTAQLGRSEGLIEGVDKYKWNLLDRQEGDYTQTKGKEVMAGFLNNYPELNVVYCENDNMAFGVIEAIEEAGRMVGTDIAAGEILVLSFDGVSETAKELVSQGKIACIGECNPHHGPRVSSIIISLVNNKEVDKISYVNESVFAYSNIVKEVVVDSMVYSVESLGNE